MHRVLIYNMAYATGAPKSLPDSILNISRYFMPTRRNLNNISRFINSQKADVIGLIEVDTGSYRSENVNQAARISKHLSNFHHSTTKYGDSLTGRVLPILSSQGNAVLTRDRESNSIYHYFPSGFKRLVIELDMGLYRFFLLHLALSKRVRQIQLNHIANLLHTNRNRPFIIGGDFNTFGGTREIESICQELNLINPNSNNMPTFPAWEPKHQIDFILCSKEVKIVNFTIPEVKLSDHLPVVLDFDI